MNRLFRIKIRWGVLRAHLSREEGRRVSEDELRDWLRDAGFTQAGDNWIVPEKDLGHLDPSEVESAEPVGGDGDGDGDDPGSGPP